jgi:hypothetical protein
MAERKRRRPERYRPAQGAPDDYGRPAADDVADQDGLEEDDPDNDSGAVGASATDAPDVFLDVPALKVEEIHLEVDDLKAQVSLQASVLDLLKLHVGAEVSLARVLLDVKGVDAVAQLKVRLDKVALILGEVMRTIDDNPQILTDLTRGVGAAAAEIGQGAAGGLREVGKGTGRAVEEVGEGTGRAVEEVGEGASSGIESVGSGVREAAGDLGEGVGRTAEHVTEDDVDSAGGARHGRGSADRRREARRTDRGPAERPPSPSRDRPRRRPSTEGRPDG